MAGSIEKCVDGTTGKVTYTDKGCKSKETHKDTYLPGTNTRKTDKNTMVSFKVSEIGLLTEQASDQCTKNATKYFADSHSDIGKDASSEFLEVKDRSIKGADVQIVLEGVVRYKSKNQPQEIKIQCTASKSRNSDWELAFKDSESNSKSGGKTDQN